MIHLWNDKQLARDFKNRAVTEKEKFTYFLMYMFVPVALKLIGSLLPKRDTSNIATSHMPIAGEFFGLAFLATGILVICYLYSVNSKGDGISFIERYICLNVALALRTFAFAVLVSAGVGVIAVLTSIKVIGPNPYVPMVILVTVAASFLWFYITRFTLLLKIASGQME